MSSRSETEYRYEKLTWPEIEDAVDAAQVCVVPCGAVEQHGPHLPLDVDLVCPTGIARGAGRQVAEKMLVLPTVAYYNPQGAAHLMLDFDRNVRPFGEEPTADNFLYIASDEVLNQPGTPVRLEIMLSDPSFSEKPIASEDLILEWQYHTGKRWRTFGKTG